MSICRVLHYLHHSFKSRNKHTNILYEYSTLLLLKICRCTRFHANTTITASPILYIYRVTTPLPIHIYSHSIVLLHRCLSLHLSLIIRVCYDHAVGKLEIFMDCSASGSLATGLPVVMQLVEGHKIGADP